MKYKHLNLFERERIFELKIRGFSIRQIAKKVGRSHSTVSRELSRNAKYGRKYMPCVAQRNASRVALKQRFRAALKNPFVFVYVRKKLRLGWSPELIAGRLSKVYPKESVSPEAIYKYIYKKKNRREKLWEYLDRGHKKRKVKSGRKVHKKTKIPNAVSIDLRPKEAETRKVPGHWETDNMEGKKTDKNVVSSLVERQTRKTHLSLLPSRKSLDKNNHITKTLNNYPNFLTKTLTADNGAENTKHQEITKDTGVPVFFCHPYHSWEKGTVERKFREVRRYIPKGTSLKNITQKRIKQIEEVINNKPMKILDYLTPNEVMSNIQTGQPPLDSGALQD